MASHLHRYKTLFNRFPYISYAYRADCSILMQHWNPLLYDLSNDHRLADCLSHCFQDNFFYLFILKQSGGIADVVSDSTLGSDADLVLADGQFRLRLLDSPVAFHSGFWISEIESGLRV